MRPFSTSSRLNSIIGKRIIKYPKTVSVTTVPYVPTPSFPECTTQLQVVGPLGTLSMPIFSFVSIGFPEPPLDAEKVYLSVSVEDAKIEKQKAMWGTTNAKLTNMVEGVMYGFTVPIKLVGVGYRATLENGTIALKLGFSNIITEKIPEGLDVKIPNPQRIVIRGIDIEAITQFAASIRKWRPPEPYNQKGVFVGDETIKKKEGKKR